MFVFPLIIILCYGKVSYFPGYFVTVVLPSKLTGILMIDKKRRRIIKIGSFISMLIFLSCLSIAIYYQHHPYGTPPQHLIINGNLTIKTDSYKAFNFTIPMDITQSQVNGDFAVYPTNSSGLRVFIWDNAAFNNWQSGYLHCKFEEPNCPEK
jgi:hypothetical protein